MSHSTEVPKPNSEFFRGVKATGREIAHQVNSPLTTALGNLELLLEDPSLGSGQRLFVTEAMTALTQIAGIVRDVSLVRRAVTYMSPVGESLNIQESLKEPTPKHTEPS